MKGTKYSKESRLQEKRGPKEDEGFKHDMPRLAGPEWTNRMNLTPCASKNSSILQSPDMYAGVQG